MALGLKIIARLGFKMVRLDLETSDFSAPFYDILIFFS